MVPRHELFAFMRSLQSDMAHEYERIRRRVGEDPGTAGDQGEENWATLLRSWLPAQYPVVTKGRIIDADGRTSPQLDVLVLSPDYPRALRDKKLYFAAGVVAAFECKLTLKSAHLSKAFATCKVVKQLYAPTPGTPAGELQKPIVYGVLAHAHSWKPDEHGLVFPISMSLERAWPKAAEHPSDLVDVVCVADAITFALSKSLSIAPHWQKDQRSMFRGLDKNGGVMAGSTGYWIDEPDKYDRRGTVLGSLIAHVVQLLAYDAPHLRPFARYLLDTQIMGVGLGRATSWASSVLSADVVAAVRRNGYSDDTWSPWREYIC